MLRVLFATFLQRVGEATTHSAPTPIERVLAHAGYLAGLGMVARIGLGAAGMAGPLGVGTLLQTLLLAAALSFLFLFYLVYYRRVPPERWFVSHLVWISMTYAYLFLVAAGGLLAWIVMLLFVAVMPPLAGVLVYGPMAAMGLAALWFTGRMVFGYLALLRSQGAGGLVPDEADAPVASPPVTR